MTVRKKDKKSTLVTLVSLLAIIVCGVVILAIDSPSRVKKKLSFGEQYLAEEDYERAFENFRDVMERDPGNAEAYLGAAKASVGLGKREQAISILEKGYEAVRDERLPALINEIENGPTP